MNTDEIIGKLEEELTDASMHLDKLYQLSGDLWTEVERNWASLLRGKQAALVFALQLHGWKGPEIPSHPLPELLETGEVLASPP